MRPHPRNHLHRLHHPHLAHDIIIAYTLKLLLVRHGISYHLNLIDIPNTRLLTCESQQKYMYFQEGELEREVIEEKEKQEWLNPNPCVPQAHFLQYLHRVL